MIPPIPQPDVGEEDPATPVRAELKDPILVAVVNGAVNGNLSTAAVNTVLFDPPEANPFVGED